MEPRTTDDIANLDDPAFLDAKARARTLHEQEPDDIGLAVANDRMNAEFDRRASAAWQAGTD